MVKVKILWKIEHKMKTAMDCILIVRLILSN